MASTEKSNSRASKAARGVTVETVVLDEEEDMALDSAEPSSKKRKAAYAFQRGQAGSGVQPESTGRHDTAIGWFDELMSEDGYSYASITAESLADDSYKEILSTFGTKLAAQGLPSKKGTSLKAETVKKYFGEIIKGLKDRFPEESKTWDNEALEDVKKDCYEWYAKAVSDGVGTGSLTNCDIIPIPTESQKRVGDKFIAPPNHPQAGELVDMSLDLHAIHVEALKTGNKTANIYMKLLMLIMTALAVGRGGECKFVRMSKMWFEPSVNCLMAAWFMSKQLTALLTSFTAHYHAQHYSICFLFLFAAYAFMENGLYRGELDVLKDEEIRLQNLQQQLKRATTKEEKDELKDKVKKQLLIVNGLKRRADYLFPKLHDLKNSRTAEMLTDFMKRYLPDAFCNFMQVVSSKCLRIGGTSLLHLCRSITDAEMRHRGGWADESHAKNYIYATLGLTLMPVKVLTCQPNLNAEIVLPRLSCLPPGDQTLAVELLKSGYKINVPAFKAEGRLYPFLQICHARLLCAYNDMVGTLGGTHPIIRKLNAELKAIIGPHQESHAILRRISSVIKRDWQARQGKTPVYGDMSVPGTYDFERMRFVESSLQSMHQDVTFLKSTVAKLDAVVDTLSRQNKMLLEKIDRLEQANGGGSETVSTKLDDLLTMVSNMSVGGIPAATSVARANASQDALPALALPVSQVDPEEAPVRANAFALMQEGSMLTDGGTKPPMLAGQELSAFLEELLKGRKDKLTPFRRVRDLYSGSHNEKAKVRRCLDLVEFLVTRDEWERLQQGEYTIVNALDDRAKAVRAFLCKSKKKDAAKKTAGVLGLGKALGDKAPGKDYTLLNVMAPFMPHGFQWEPTARQNVVPWHGTWTEWYGEGATLASMKEVAKNKTFYEYVISKK